MTRDEIFSSVGKGWHLLLDELLSKIPAERVDCVKEKFGKLRIGTEFPDEAEIVYLIDLEERSGAICEPCGNPGQLVDRAGWLKTLCEECGCGLRTIDAVLRVFK